VTQTVFGLLADDLGHASGGDGRAWATPAAEIRSVQARSIPITREHDPHDVVGEVVYLQRDRGGVWAVGQIDDGVSETISVRVAGDLVKVPAPLFWSASRLSTPDFRDVLIQAIGLTTSPARICARPVELLPGRLDSRRPRWSNLPDSTRDLLTRAAGDHLDRRRTRAPLVVRHVGVELAPLTPSSGWSMMETRSATVAEVEPAQRLVTLLVAPAEVPAQINERGRSYVETYAHGCFADSAADPGKVKLNRGHVLDKVIGKATEIDPWSELGCVGVFRIAKTPLGDESLALLDDGVLAASAGFQLAERDGEQWQDRLHRRVTRALLHHVALTPDPAHQGAVVLDVRRGSLAGAR
jgi:hypothetical protein